MNYYPFIYETKTFFMKKLFTICIGVICFYGCQDYDDQFDALNDKIQSLNDEIQSLNSLSSDVSKISSDISALSKTVTENNSSIEDEIKSLLTRINQIQTSVEEVISNIPDVSAIETEVADLNAEINQILETLESLRSVENFYGDVYIDDLEDLVTAEGLFLSLGENSPMVAVWGDIEIDIDEGNELDSKEMVDRINALASRFVAVYDRDEYDDTDDDGDGDLSIYNESDYTITLPNMKVASYGIYDTTGRVFFPELTNSPNVSYYAYTNDDEDEFFPADSIQYLFPKLTQVEDLEIYGINGELRLPQITSVLDDIYLDADGATPTLIDISNIVIDADSFNGNAFDNFDSSTVEYFNLGEFPLGDNLEFTAEGAQVITSMPITYDETLELEVPNGSITFNNPLSLDEDIELLLSRSDINLSIVDGDTNGYDITLVSAGDIFLDDLVDSDYLSLTASGTISLDALVTVNGDLSFEDNEITDGGYTIEIPQLDMNNVSGDLRMPSTGVHTLHVANFSDSNYVGNEIENLTVGSQSLDLDLSDWMFANYIKTLSYTGSNTTDVTPGAITNDLIISQTTSLTSVVISESSHIGTLTVFSNTALLSLESAGVVIKTEVASNSAMTSLILGHSFIEGEDALTISVSDNHYITALDLSTIEKVKTIFIDNNTSLSSIVGPGASNLAEPLATISLTITNNAFEGTYKPAVAATETTPYSAATGSATVVDAFRPLIDGYLEQTRTAAVSYTIYIDDLDTDADGEFDDGNIETILDADTAAQAGPDGIVGNDDDQSNGGKIDILAELNIF